ncbi:hypothetical protein DUNSADRAFT_3095 [Dunaliella salina]|uniref:Uncharacterized protein n=1 Tax=Dunaliella salina TaxID=3046 RepID=A0ABQ7GUK8_DUNSA|nr:hypothetical protein DUNSADRAFT_3095 [Dunaliella salina]|eukprot:KAF5838299.1 hypothetical protein DUNSADRAFT_3095 [Dunaliella salina]
MPQLGAAASSPFEAAAREEFSHVSASAPGGPSLSAATRSPQPAPPRSPSSLLHAPPGPPASLRSPKQPAAALGALHEASHAAPAAPGQQSPQTHAAASGAGFKGHRSNVPPSPPTAGQPLQPSQRPGSQGIAPATDSNHASPPQHHGLLGQRPMDSSAHGGSHRPNSRGNLGRLMVAVNEHRPGSQGSKRQGAGSPSRGSPLGADAAGPSAPPPRSPAAKHAPSHPSPKGSRSASPTAMGKRYGSWFVPPDAWSNVYEGEGPDPEEIARLAAKSGVDVEGLPILDGTSWSNAWIASCLDLSPLGAQPAQPRGPGTCSGPCLRNHLQERSLRSPEALEHAVASAQEENASRPASVGQASGPGSSAALPPVGEQEGSAKGARAGTPTRPRAGTNESTFKSHDAEFIPPPAPVPFTPRNDDGAQAAPMSGYGAVKPTPTITYVHPSALSALDDMDLDDIISPELREAVRRSLAMNDALTEHDRKMREYEEAKRAAKRAARFQRDLEAAEAEAAAAGLPGLNRKQWGRLAALHGFSFGPAGSIVAKDTVNKQSNIQVGLPRKLASQKIFSNKRRLPQLPTLKDRARIGSAGQAKGVSVKRRASSPGVRHVSREYSRGRTPPSRQRALDDRSEPIPGRRRAALLARGPPLAGQWARGPCRFSTMGAFNDNQMLAATGHLDRDGQVEHRSSNPDGAHEDGDGREEGGSGDDTASAKVDDQDAFHQRTFAPGMSESQGRVRDRPTFRINVLKNVAAHRLQQHPRTSPPSSPPLSGKQGGRRWSPPAHMPEGADQLQALAQAAAMDAASKSAQQSPRELWIARQLSKAATLGGRSR